MKVMTDGSIKINCDEEIGEAIFTLGDKFRGLWRCNELTHDDNFEIKWYVTFKYKGEYVETPTCDNIHEALTFALKKVGKNKL